MSKKSKDYFVKTLTKDNRIDNALLENYQFESHGFAWFETYRIGLRETFNWLIRLKDSIRQRKLIIIYYFIHSQSMFHKCVME